MRMLESSSTQLENENLDKYREELREYAKPISTSAMNSPLPPLREINHTIPLMDENAVYAWRPSKCPEALRPLWNEKREAYLSTGRWRMTNARNTSPMLLLTKPGTGKNGVPPKLRTVIDLRQRNKNTRKLPSPLPDMEGILRRVARRRYRSMIDGKDAYEQIRVAPEHVERTAMASPDGNMVSLVLQQGDCNAVATYQSLMNHIFGPYIGQFMDVYLDDIIIYSDTPLDHLRHVKLVVDVLKREKFYLSAEKQSYFCREAKILGRIVDDEGIRMDPDKVDSIANWKVPTSKELLRGFLGSVGYLADDIATIRIPMGILTSLIGSDSAFKWTETHQRAFDEVKQLVQAHRDHHRVPLDYSPMSPQIWLITDGSHGGIAGVVAQGDDWRDAKIAAFFSAKLTSAQSNYPVHEIEMLAGVESMLRHRDILQGCHFIWLTDHKGLTHLWHQKNLSGRQARWVEKLSEFNFDIEYVPGVENVLADALSRIYSNDAPGTVRAPSEFTQYDEHSHMVAQLNALDISRPVFAGLEAMAVRTRSSSGAPVTPNAPASQPAPKRVVDTRSRPSVKHAGHLTGKARTTGVKPTETEAPKVRTRRGVPPPETGRPETSREFAKRIKRVVLHGPRAERQEGANPPDLPDEQSGGSNETINDSPGDTLDEGLEPDREHDLLTVILQDPEGVNVADEVRERYHEDAFFADILRNPQHHKNFAVKQGLIFLKEKGYERLCIPNVLNRTKKRSVRELVIRYAHSLLAHLGATKTLGYLRDQVWWKTLAHDVQKYCETCMTCRRSKPSNQKPYGLLNPLPVASEPWEAIGIDFVGPLPESKDRDASYDSITTVIDLLTGMVHLIPSRTTYTAKQVAELIFAEVFKLHGMPKVIISDRDTLFTSQFWTHLHKLVGVELHMSSAYHPQSDGSTERANRTITQMLRQCVAPNQKDWVSKLPGIEFAINLARSESTGYAPFFLNTGRLPRSLIWNNAGKEEYPSVRIFAQKMKSAIMAAHDSIIAARVKQTRDANRRRRPAPFVEGDLVYISTKNISLPRGLARKLALKYIGPYKIEKDYKNNSYLLDLSRNLRRRGVHNVFHASLLRMHEPNDDRLFPGRLDSQIAEFEDRDNEWAIAKILSHAGEREGAVFEAEWKSGDRTWVPYSAIRHLGALAEYLELLGCADITQLGAGSGTPPADPQIFMGSIQLSNLNPQGLKAHRKGRRKHRRTRRSTRASSLHPTQPPDLHSILPDLLQQVFGRPIIMRNDPIGHRFFTRLADGASGVLNDEVNNVAYSYPPAMLTMYVEFDNLLRRNFVEGNVEGVALTVPGGYTSFAAVWNRDTECQYQFSTYHITSQSIMVRGRPIPREILAPSPTIQPATSTPSDERTKRRYQFAVDKFLDSSMRHEQFIDKKREERKRTSAEKRSAARVFERQIGGGRPGGRKSVVDGGVKKNSPTAVAGPSRTIHTSPTSSTSASQITSHVPANPPARPDFSLEGRSLPQGCTRKEPVDASSVPSNTCSSKVDVAMHDATGETLDLIDFDEPVELSSTAQEPEQESTEEPSEKEDEAAKSRLSRKDKGKGRAGPKA